MRSLTLHHPTIGQLALPLAVARHAARQIRYFLPGHRILLGTNLRKRMRLI